jgi:hypothetical protein
MTCLQPKEAVNFLTLPPAVAGMRLAQRLGFAIADSVMSTEAMHPQSRRNVEVHTLFPMPEPQVP